MNVFARHGDWTSRRPVLAAGLAAASPDVLASQETVVTPDSASVRFWTGRQSLGKTSVCYQDAWAAAHPGEPGHTFTPRNPLVADAWRPRPGRGDERLGRRVDGGGEPVTGLRGDRDVALEDRPTP